MTHVFDINDNARIYELIRNRKEGAFVMPLYIKIYNSIYDIRDIDEIDNYVPSALKIGFGSIYGFFNKTQFPIKYIDSFDIVKQFTIFDDRINNDMNCYVFESSDPYSNINHDIFEQISYYYWLFRDYLDNRMKDIRAERIRKAMEEDM